MNRLKITIAGIAVLSFALGIPAAYGATSTASHAVTVNVPSVISLTADTAGIVLNFTDFVTGSESDIKTVNYTVKANNMSKTNGVVSAKLASLFTDLSLRGDPGAYVKTGGNAHLEESAVGYITIDAVGVNLMNRVTDSGTGKVTRGTFPVSYKAVASADLSPDVQIQNLTITLTDV